MKKVSKILLIFALIMILITQISFATQEEQTADTTEGTTEEPAEVTEIDDNMEDVAGGGTIIQATARVIESKGVKEIVSGDITNRVQEIKIEIIDGVYVGEEFDAEYKLAYDIEGKIPAYELEVGTKLLVSVVEDADGNTSVTIRNVVKTKYMVILAIIFLVSIVILTGKKGIKTVISLLATLAYIYFILLKGILAERNVIVLSIVTVFLMATTTFVVMNGFKKKTVSAIIGTVLGALLAGGITYVFNRFALLTGAGEDSIQQSIDLAKNSLNFKEMLFAEVMIAATGACMDIALSITDELDKIKKTEADITWKELFKKGMETGKEMIGTMSNTLILVFIGGYLSITALFFSCGFTSAEILNRDIISEEIISALSGSIGVIYVVPIVSFVYSFLNREKIIYNKKAHNKVEGRRTLKI